MFVRNGQALGSVLHSADPGAAPKPKRGRPPKAKEETVEEPTPAAVKAEAPVPVKAETAAAAETAKPKDSAKPQKGDD